MNKLKVNSWNLKLKNFISVFLNILLYKEEKKIKYGSGWRSVFWGWVWRLNYFFEEGDRNRRWCGGGEDIFFFF